MKTLKINFRQLYLILLGLSSTLYIVRIKGIPLFYLLAFLGIIFFRKLSKRIDATYGMYVIVILLSLVVNISNGYLYTMVLSTVLSLIICLLYMGLLKQSLASLDYLILGIKSSCILQIAWCLLQYVLYNFARIDINQAIFSDFLHMIDTASRYVNGRLVLTGFCWHPSNMVPVLILSLVLFNTWYIWLICIFIAVGMNSSTAILAILALGIVKLIRLMIQKEIFNHLTMTKFFAGVFAVLVVVSIFATTNLGTQIVENVARLIGRINGTNITMSTVVHRSYYSLLPQVIKNSTVGQVLFGYGPGCSGLAITRINGQYSLLGTWVVESDYMNILYGYGAFGLFFYFAWIISKVTQKGSKQSFFIEFLIPLLIAGITYNVQYYWVVFTILVMSAYQYKEALVGK